MNLRLVQFNLAPGQRSEATAIADRVIPVIRAQPGCKGGEFFADYEAGEYGIVALWESTGAADAAAGIVSPILMSALTGANATGERRRLYELYEPRP